MRANWRKYNGAIIPLHPPHIEVKESSIKIQQIVQESNVFFARWISHFDCKKQLSFWYVIHDTPMGMNDYSTNTRNQIRKGLKNFQIKIIDRSIIEQEGYDIYTSALQQQNTFWKLKGKEPFIKDLEGEWEFWGIYFEASLIGYSQNKVTNGCCDYSTIKIDPRYKKRYPSYALFYLMNKFYLNQKKLNYVSDGARSLAHQSNVQDFLIRKFKFRKAFCYLHVVYNPKITGLINMLFPFRNIFYRINIRFFQKIGVVLKQEEIIRKQINE